MLILTRRPQESIIINGNIKITILKMNRGQVRIGIDAPPEVLILREELVEKS